MSERGRSSAVRPLVVGDLVRGQRVAGFGWVQPAEPDRYLSTHVDDRLLCDGDEFLSLPPDRTVPQTAETAELTGIVPPADIAHVRRADAIDPSLSLRFEALLDLPGAAWQPLIRPLLAAVHATGHRLWLAGGAVRDVLSGVPLYEVQDLDLAGTAPPGRFSDIVRQVLWAARMSECRTTVTPNSLVCAVARPSSRDRLIEYRGLSQGGFRFPTVGSALAEDARHRDFAFNALMYDVLDHLVFDASGTGVADLLAPSRRFTPIRVSADPMVLAEVIVRGMKFAYRWRTGSTCDFTEFHQWISTLPHDFHSGFSRTEWGVLIDYRRRCAPDPVWAAGFATTLPKPGSDFVTGLLERGV
jgi:hypothetical protein